MSVVCMFSCPNNALMVDSRINISDEILSIAIIKEESSSLIRVNAFAGTGKPLF